MFLKQWALGFLIVFALAPGRSQGTPAGSSPSPVQPALKPVVGYPQSFGSSPMVRSLSPPVLPRVPLPGSTVHEVPLLGQPATMTNLPQHPADPLVQSSPGSKTMPEPLLTFEGLSDKDNDEIGVGRGMPSDQNGAIGPHHYVQFVNSLFRVYDRSGNPLTDRIPLSSLFPSNSGPCAAEDDGDIIVLYDPLEDRWLLSQFAIEQAPNYYECIAVSKTGDPTGDYWTYSYLMPNNLFNDYPKFGVWPDAYYMTDNEFGGSGEDNSAIPADGTPPPTAAPNPFHGNVGVGAFAFDKSKMLQGDPSASYIYFEMNALDPEVFGVLPASLDGPPPPSGTPEYLMSLASQMMGYPYDGLNLYTVHADFNAPQKSTLTRATALSVAPFDPSFNVVNGQGSTSETIPEPPPADSTMWLGRLSDRLMYRLQFRNFGNYSRLVVNHTVNVTPFQSGIHAGIRWYVVDPAAPDIVDQGTFAPDADHRWMGSAAMDKHGNLAIGYSVSGLDTFPSIRYAGRFATDPPGQMTLAEATLYAGSGSQLLPNPNISQDGTPYTGRWGDYSSLMVDPADDETFWYTNQYYAVSAAFDWRTRIGAFKIPANPSGIVQGTVVNTFGFPIPNAFVSVSNGQSLFADGNGFFSFTLSPGNYILQTADGIGDTAGEAVTVRDGVTDIANLIVSGTSQLSVSSVQVDDSAGNGNGQLDLNECVKLNITLLNTGTADLTGVTAQLLPAAGVHLIQDTSNYGFVFAPLGTFLLPALNNIPFSLSVDSIPHCGVPLNLTLHVSSDQGTIDLPVQVPTGTSQRTSTFSSSGPVPIPDASPVGATLPIPVSGFTGPIGHVTVAVHVTHPNVSDLQLLLIGPDGTQVILATQEGGTSADYGASCPAATGGTLFDDAGSALGTSGPPGRGPYQPQQPLQAFVGKSDAAVNGTWKLKVIDLEPEDVGQIDCAAVILSPMTCSDQGDACQEATADLTAAVTSNASPTLFTADDYPLNETVSVTNNGPDTAKHVHLTDDMLGYLQSLEAFLGTPVQTFQASQGTCQRQDAMLDTQFLCDFGDLPAGGTATLTYSFPNLINGPFLQEVKAYSDAADPKPADNSLFSQLTIGPKAGDVNGDNLVNTQDLNIMLEVLVGLVPVTPQILAGGDVRPKPGTNGMPYGDGRIGADDLDWEIQKILGLVNLP